MTEPRGSPETIMDYESKARPKSLARPLSGGRVKKRQSGFEIGENPIYDIARPSELQMKIASALTQRGIGYEIQKREDITGRMPSGGFLTNFGVITLTGNYNPAQLREVLTIVGRENPGLIEMVQEVPSVYLSVSSKGKDQFESVLLMNGKSYQSYQ